MTGLREIAAARCTGDPTATSLYHWGVYAEVFPAAPRAICEVGVYRGESLRMLREAYPDARIVGLDRTPVEVPGCVTVAADQHDVKAVDAATRPHGPYDVVIDDGAHTGDATRWTWAALWPQVTPGGIYIICDWGTGYWRDWPDGRERVPGDISFTAGMVGVVKGFVDFVHADAWGGHTLGIARVDVRRAVCILTKERG